MNGQLRYGYLDEFPVVFDDREAWQFNGDRWLPLNIVDAFVKVRLLGKAEFDDYAGPGVPALPMAAFRRRDRFC